MTIKIYKLTKDTIGRMRHWAIEAGKDPDSRLLCRRCTKQLEEGESIVYKTGHSLGHIYHKKCAKIVKII